jgi:hypothetical protein
MEPFFAAAIVAFLDPIRALITFGFVFLIRRPFGMLIAAAASSIVCEVVLSLAIQDRSWVAGIAAGLVASVGQAAILIWLVRAIRRRPAVSVRKSLVHGGR